MKRKVRKEPEGGSKKRKEVGNESLLASMFQRQQTANDLQKARETYNAILEKGKQLGLEEAAHAEPVRRAENDTHPIVESDKDDATVDATVPKRSVNPNCVPTPFDPDAVCDKSVHDVLVTLSRLVTASPLPNRLRRSVTQCPKKKGMTRARV
jgi:hypothetical protein